MHILAGVEDVLLNIYFIADPHNKARVSQLLFTYQTYSQAILKY